LFLAGTILLLFLDDFMILQRDFCGRLACATYLACVTYP
jgi:hypothetical protein